MYDNAKKFDDLRVGDEASFEETINAELVEKFGELSGDKNPLHFVENYAKRTEFGRPIAHGMIAGMFFSRLVGMYLPGRYALYLSQQLNFHKPIYFGTEAVVNGRIVQKIDALRVVRIKTEISGKGTKQLLVSGEAVVKLLE